MGRRWIAMTLVLTTAATASPAQACIIRVDTNLEDVRFADTVVVGRVANYRVVQDESFRWRRQQLARPNLTPERRRELLRQTSFLSDYARFDVLVDEILVGQPARRLTVTWDNSTFGEPATMPPGPYLIALRQPLSPALPLRGPSATIRPTPRGGPTLLQAPCAGAFIFPIESQEAQTIRAMLARTPTSPNTR